MNRFADKLTGLGLPQLAGLGIEVIQLNVGLRCNLRCAHCHVASGPRRREQMDWPTMAAALEAAGRLGVGRIDVTGGAPEMNPHFRALIEAAAAQGLATLVRTNLTILLEPGYDELPSFFRAHGTQIVASLPCYSADNVDRQRGAGVYEGSIEAIRRLNAEGYGRDPALALTLVYNPGGPVLPPPQAVLEADYRRELRARFGIEFTRLITITNMPIGRFMGDLRARQRDGEYLDLLEAGFNAATLDGLMCRRQISVDWDGRIHDCDFNLALKLPVNHGAPDRITAANIRALDLAALARRRIVTGAHCLGCTAGAGSSCGGALVTNGGTA